MARLTKERAMIIQEFIEELGLVPKSLVTKEVIELIHKSWNRAEQVNKLNSLEKQAQKDFIKKLSQRAKRRLPNKVLRDMQPININPLFDNF